MNIVIAIGKQDGARRPARKALMPISLLNRGSLY